MISRFHYKLVRRVQADSASSRITVSDCKSISHFVGMSRDVAFVMQFRDRECRRVRVAESRAHTRDDMCVRTIVRIPDIFMRSHTCLYRSTDLTGEGKIGRGLILRRVRRNWNEHS